MPALMGSHDGVNLLWIFMLRLIRFMDVLILVPRCTNLANYLASKRGFMQGLLYGCDVNLGIRICMLVNLLLF
jgi:hypothetical protein